MQQLGLTEEEQGKLWVGGVDSIAWISQLRPQDFSAAGVDIQTRSMAAKASRAARDAFAAQEEARAWAIRVTNETDGAMGDVGGVSPGLLDQSSPLRTATQRLEDCTQRLHAAQSGRDQAQRDADEAATRLHEQLRAEDALAQGQQDQIRKLIEMGAQDFRGNRELNFGRLSEQGVETILAAVKSVDQLCALNLGAMRRLGLSICDRRMLDSIRKAATSQTATRDATSSRVNSHVQPISTPATTASTTENEAHQLRRSNRELQDKVEQLGQQLAQLQHQRPGLALKLAGKAAPLQPETDPEPVATSNAQPAAGTTATAVTARSRPRPKEPELKSTSVDEDQDKETSLSPQHFGMPTLMGSSEPEPEVESQSQPDMREVVAPRQLQLQPVTPEATAARLESAEKPGLLEPTGDAANFQLDEHEETPDAFADRETEFTNRTSPATAVLGKDKHWSSLTEDERHAVRELGWSQASWDNGTDDEPMHDDR